ncbi:MAG TPA: hypothetical protein VG248_03350 [Caulobacteraceae bacterium]|jgi:hypothetical protein|nr:hypothetical protein [Caulobacteraceae bacterium]
MIPDQRGWAAIGLILLYVFFFTCRAIVPALAHDETVNGILNNMQGIVIGGLVGFYFGQSKKDGAPPVPPA